jgi:hypothetical protein
MSPSEEFGENGREAALDGTPRVDDAAEIVPTHLLTMTRGAPDAVPDRVVVALHAMGIKTRDLEGRGLGLAFVDDIPEFLRRAPFQLDLLAQISDAPEAGEGSAASAADCANEADPAEAGDPVGAAAMTGAPDAASAEAVDDDSGAFDDAGEQPVPNGAGDDLEPAAPCLDDGEDGAGLAQMPDLAQTREDGPRIRVVESADPADLPEPEEAMAAPAAEADPAAGPKDDSAADPAADPQSGAPLGARIDRIMDRLELIEFMLSEQRASAESAPSLDAGRDFESRLDAIEAALAKVGRVEAQVAQGFSRLASFFQRTEDALADLTARPAPVADIADPPFGPDDLDTAIGIVLERIDALAGSMEAGQAGVLGEMRGLLSRIDAHLDAGDAEDGPAVSASVEAEAMASVITALSEQLIAARGAASHGETSAVLEGLASTQEGIVSMISQLLERPDTRLQASDHESLRDLRILVAELLAENRRISAA